MVWEDFAEKSKNRSNRVFRFVSLRILILNSKFKISHYAFLYIDFTTNSNLLDIISINEYNISWIGVYGKWSKRFMNMA